MKQNIEQVAAELGALIEKTGMNMETVDCYISQKRQDNADMNSLINLMTQYINQLGDWELAAEIGLHGFCSCMMSRLSGVTKEMFGEETWGKIFGGVEVPISDWTDWTQTERKDFALIMQEKFLSVISLDEYKRALEGVSRTWGSDIGHDAAKKDVTIDGLDAYIRELNENFLDNLHNQYPSSNDAVMEEFNTEKWKIRRVGSKIIFAQYPFLMDKYAAQTNSRMKRYYACRCPWVRASILKGEAVSSSFCHCNLGYQKSGYDSFFGQYLDGRVIKSVLEEDAEQCVFELDIPEEYRQEWGLE